MKISQSWTKRKTAKQIKSTLPFCVDGAIRANYCLGFSDNLPYEKVGKNEPVCIADEVPFDIPENWEWVRVKHFTTLYNGRAFKPSDWTDTGLPIVRIQNLNNQNSPYNLYNGFVEPEYQLYGGELLFAWSGTPGTSFGAHIWCGKEAVLNQHIFRLDFSEKVIYKPYYMYALNQRIGELIKAAHGSAGLQHVTKGVFENTLIPIPPYKEQIRIVNKLNQLAPAFSSYSKISNSIKKLNNEFPEKLKKSILQDSVQGKLVPQDPADEPASVLLERIRAEKEQLIKAGKIKRDKHESVIFRRDNSYYEKVDGIERCIDDELPFEIPDSWEWTRMGTIVTLLSGTDFKPEEYNESGNGIPYITGASSLSKNQVLVTRWTETPRIIANKGDILLVCKGSGYGKSIICNVDVAHIARQIMAIKKNDSLDMEYIRFFLQANFDLLKSKGQGVIPGIDRNSVLTLLLPLPPLSEQYKISTQVKQILQNISRL